MNTTRLHVAIKNKQIGTALMLIENGADVNAQEGVAPQSDDPEDGVPGHTPLTLATKRGLVDVVRALLKHYADPNIQDNCGVTALYAAALRANLELVKLLLEYGADQTLPARLTGLTPLEVITPLFSRLNHTNVAYRTKEDLILLDTYRKIMGLLRGKAFRESRPRKKHRHK